MNGVKAVKTLAANADIEDRTKEWAAQHTDVKAKARTRRATMTAAKAAKKAIAQKAPAKKNRQGGEDHHQAGRRRGSAPGDSHLIAVHQSAGRAGRG